MKSKSLASMKLHGLKNTSNLLNHLFQDKFFVVDFLTIILLSSIWKIPSFILLVTVGTLIPSPLAHSALVRYLTELDFCKIVIYKPIKMYTSFLFPILYSERIRSTRQKKSDHKQSLLMIAATIKKVFHRSYSRGRRWCSKCRK